MLLYQFTRPFAFRKISHPNLKFINLIIPLPLTIFIVIGYSLLPVKPALFGSGSITGHALSFLVILPGFFIAALAAVATFQRDELDEEMPAPTPTLDMRTGNEWAPVRLTHRVFLCHLFSYLTVVAFTSIAVGVLGDLLAPSILHCVSKIPNQIVQEWAEFALKIIYLASFAWLLANLVVATLYGLYFLVERIHRPHT